MFISNHVVKSVMGKQTLQKYETYDTRLVGKTYYWRDSYGNTYTHYLERQQDGKFYGEFYNKRTRKTIRFWFVKKKSVHSRLTAIYWKYSAKSKKTAENLAKKRAEREASKPKLTVPEKQELHCKTQIARLEANIRKNESKVRGCNTRIKTYKKKIQYHKKRLENI